MLSARAQFEQAIQEAIRLLPPQVAGAPFAFENPLRAFEDRHFDIAVTQAASVLEIQPFLTEAEYHEALKTGQFHADDLDEILASEVNVEVIAGVHDRRSLRRELTLYRPREFDGSSIQWLQEEGDVLARFRRDSPLAGRNERVEVKALHEAINMRTPEANPPLDRPARPRDAILAATGVDLDAVVRPFFVKALRSFTGLGQSWPMANREHGLFAAVRMWIASEGKQALPSELQPVALLLESDTAKKNDSRSFSIECMEALGVQQPDWSGYIRRKVLLMRGWAALFADLQRFADSPTPALAPKYRLADFLAVQLALTLASLESRTANPRGWQFLGRSEADSKTLRMAEAFRLFDACQILGLSTSQMRSISDDQFDLLRAEIKAFPEIERRRILHLAFERGRGRRLLERVSTAVAINAAPRKPCLACVVFCADDKLTLVRQQIVYQFPAIHTDGVPSFLGAYIEDAAAVELEARIDAVARLMSLTGLEENWPRLIVLAGHEVVSEESALDWRTLCGVCRGNCDVEHAQHLATWANDSSVRRGLQLRGHSVPMESWFVAARVRLGPNGAVDAVGRETIPDIHLERLDRVETMLHKIITGHNRPIPPGASTSLLRGRIQSIWERLSTKRSASTPNAVRSEGHRGSNLCLIGFSDIPNVLLGEDGAFMASYQSARDPDGRILSELLDELVHACSRVNLNYLFARTDIDHFGRGNEHSTEDGELKHADSDLCAGLPWREVSEHEPERLTIIVADTPERVSRALGVRPRSAALVERGWVHLFACDGRKLISAGSATSACVRRSSR